jgi:hypothetical protein
MAEDEEAHSEEGEERAHPPPLRGSDANAKAEAQATDPAVVLRKFLAVERMPQTGWRLLAQHSAAVFFGNGSASSGAISYVIVERHETWGPGYTLPRQGSWGVAGWGGCYLRRYTPSLDTAEWILADRGPASNAQQFIALVHISGCFGGRPTPLGDIHKPEIRYRRDEVAITFFAEFKPPGSYTCQGSPPTPYKVTLSEPLDSPPSRRQLVPSEASNSLARPDTVRVSDRSQGAAPARFSAGLGDPGSEATTTVLRTECCSEFGLP